MPGQGGKCFIPETWPQNATKHKSFKKINSLESPEWGGGGYFHMTPEFEFHHRNICMFEDLLVMLLLAESNMRPYDKDFDGELYSSTLV